MRRLICQLVKDISDHGYATQWIPTLLRCSENGSPRSLANDQVMRDEDASEVVVAQTYMKIITATIPAPPEFEPTACANTAMNGYWVGGVELIVSRFPRQNIIATSMPKPSVPLMSTLKIIERGTRIAAFLTSSDMCMAPSVPRKAKTGPTRPTKKDRPCVGHPPAFVKTVKTSCGELWGPR